MTQSWTRIGGRPYLGNHVKVVIIASYGGNQAITGLVAALPRGFRHNHLGLLRDGADKVERINIGRIISIERERK